MGIQIARKSIDFRAPPGILERILINDTPLVEDGVQIGLANHVIHGKRLVQFSALNFSEDSSSGLQVGGLNLAGNSSSESYKGAQVGVVNFAGTDSPKSYKGVQIGMMNVAGTSSGPYFRGVQIGVGNGCEGVGKSVQIGAINRFSEDSYGIQIGVINRKHGARTFPLIAIRWKSKKRD